MITTKGFELVAKGELMMLSDTVKKYRDNIQLDYINLINKIQAGAEIRATKLLKEYNEKVEKLDFESDECKKEFIDYQQQKDLLFLMFGRALIDLQASYLFFKESLYI